MINEAKLLCTAVISSDNKSLHVWVKVDAKDLAEYEQRRKLLFDHLADHVHPANANPSRLSRLPKAMRFDSRQELYALNVGSKSWQDFEAQIQAEAIGNRISLDVLSDFDAENDPATSLATAGCAKAVRVFLLANPASVSRRSVCSWRSIGHSAAPRLASVQNGR